MDKIFYYSGTGNSLASAKQLAAELDMQIVPITDELASSNSVFESERAIVIFPVYAYGLPKTVKRFILKNEFKISFLAVLTTCGSKSGGAFAEAVRLFKKRKQIVSYTKAIKAVENFVHLFKLPPEEEIAIQIEAQRENTKIIAEDIKNQKKNKRFLFRPGSSFVSCLLRLVTKSFAKRYKITENCNGCGICYKVCPANCIAMTQKEDGLKPSVNAKKCDSCQACLQLCPRKAIRFGKIQPSSRRYRHSDIELIEMMKDRNEY